MSESQGRMYTVWTAHHGQSGSIHVVDGDVLLIVNDLTRHYLHPDTADSLATVFREAARDARSQRNDGDLPAMTDEEVRAMNRTVNDLVLRVAALERAICTESELDSESAPMTPEEEWADVGLEGEWRREVNAGLEFSGATLDVLRVSHSCHRHYAWTVEWEPSQARHGHTLRDALRAAREHAPANLRRYLYPRDQWRSFGECEPEEGQWVEDSMGRRLRWQAMSGSVLRQVWVKDEWRPAVPPEQEAERDEVRDLRARLAEVEAERDDLKRVVCEALRELQQKQPEWSTVRQVRSILLREGDQ